MEGAHVAEGDASSGSPGEVVQLSGRTEGDLIVHIDRPAGSDAERLVGRVVRVWITQTLPLSLVGELVHAREESLAASER